MAAEIVSRDTQLLGPCSGLCQENPSLDSGIQTPNPRAPPQANLFTDIWIFGVRVRTLDIWDIWGPLLIAGDPVLADILERALVGSELSVAETRQLRHLVYMYLTQSFHMLRLYDKGLVSEADLRSAFRELAERGRFREIIEEDVSFERGRHLVLDPDGLDVWLNVEP